MLTVGIINIASGYPLSLSTMASYQAYGRQPNPAYPPSNPSPYSNSAPSPYDGDTVTSANPFTYKNGSESTGIRRDIARTPSPTPSEQKELQTGAINWKTLRNWRFWIRKEWACASSACSLSMAFIANTCADGRVLCSLCCYSSDHSTCYAVPQANRRLAYPGH